MRKQTKLVAVLSAAALLAIGASMTSFAAGWEKDEAGIWHYYDSDDEMVTGEWKKDGGKWFYLDDDGEMLIDAWVDDDYYVGDDGAMLVNQWKKTFSDDGQDDPSDGDEHWYHFGSKGKKETKANGKNISGKTYYFDEEGRMLSGWQQIGEYAYYLGGEDQGWRTENQWLWLEKSGLIENDDDEDNITGTPVFQCDDDEGEICDDEGWYWFLPSGKVYTESKKKNINGKYYIFNDHGQMLYEWIDNDTTVKVGSNAQLDGSIVATDSNGNLKKPDVAKLLYYSDVEEGWRGDGWYQIEGAEDRGKENDTNWYYIDKGEVTYAKQENKNLATYDNDKAAIYRVREKISASGNKYFCFNEEGQMKVGLQYVKDDGGFYFFESNGYPKTGRVSGVEADDDNYNFYFNSTNGKNGLGVSGEKDGYLYFNGKRLEADDDYRIYYLNKELYLVNTKGKIQKANKGKYYDIENDGIKDIGGIVKNDDDEYKVFTKGNTIESIGGIDASVIIAATEKALNDAFGGKTTESAKWEAFADVITDGDTAATVPSIQLYDDVFTYSIKNNKLETTPEWLDLNNK